MSGPLQEILNHARMRLVWFDKQPKAFRETCGRMESTLVNILEIAEAGIGAQGEPDARLVELAEAAQDYLTAQQHVWVTEETMRRLHQRLVSLAGPHLVAKCSAPRTPGQPNQ